MNARVSVRRRLAGLKDLAAFITGLPLGGRELEAAARAFPLIPLIGLLEGVLASLTLIAARLLGADPVLAGALYAGFHLLVTGGLHMDGFSDYVDVLGSRLKGDRAVEVLKDPRRGGHSVAYTAIILILSAAAAGEATTALHSQLRQGSLWLTVGIAGVYAASAEAMYIALALGVREPYQGLGGLFKDYMDTGGHVVNALVYLSTIATLSALSISTSTLWVIVAMLTAPLLFGALVARDASSRLGFVNGDVAGFAFEVTRTLLLIALAFASEVAWHGIV